jgi:putative membrane protein
MAYSEMSVLLGVLLLGAAWALAAGWKLLPLGYYAFLPGLVAILLGIRIIQLSLAGSPITAGAGFILTGLGGVGAALTLRRPDIRILRLLGALVMLAAAAIWVVIGFMAYWMHMVPPAPQ